MKMNNFLGASTMLWWRQICICYTNNKWLNPNREKFDFVFSFEEIIWYSLVMQSTFTMMLMTPNCNQLTGTSPSTIKVNKNITGHKQYDFISYDQTKYLTNTCPCSIISIAFCYSISVCVRCVWMNFVWFCSLIKTNK